MKPKTIQDVLLKLLGHDDGVEFGDGYHDDCKQEVEEALAQIQQLLEECAPEKSPPIKPEDVDMGLGEGIHAKIAISAYRNGYNQALDNWEANIIKAIDGGKS